MTVDYTKQAAADLRSITAYYAGTNDPGAGDRIRARIREVVARIAIAPESGRPVARQRGLRVVPLVRYPYLIFYEVSRPGVILILHIRHTSRRPWTGH